MSFTVPQLCRMLRSRCGGSSKPLIQHAETGMESGDSQSSANHSELRLPLSATEIKVRAERRCGELLKLTAERGERSTGGKPSKDTTVTTLDDMGLTRDESSRYQQLAAMPDEHLGAECWV